MNKKNFKQKQKGIVATLCIALMLFSVLQSCRKQDIATQKNNDVSVETRSGDGIVELGWTVRLKLKPQEDEKYLATEDPEIQDLLAKHGVTIVQTCPGAKTLELLLYYYLKGPGRMSKENRENVIKDFLSTEKFEDEVHEPEIAKAASCINPVSTSEDLNFWNLYGWPLTMIQAPCAWSITTGNPNILIGIADSEFRTTHEDFLNKFASIDGDSSSGGHHGTNVASVAAAATNNGKGIAGIGYNSRIAAHRVPHWVNAYGEVNTAASEVQIAIWNLYLNGVPIINASWTATDLTQLMAQEITQNETTLVLAGGNDTRIFHSDIANVPGVIVVSAVNSNNMHGPTGFAHNQYIDICAPGFNIWVAGANHDSHYTNVYGTSFAAPFVSGTVALMLSVKPTLKPAQIEDILKLTTDPIADASSFPGQLGAGRLNAYKAVQASATLSSLTGSISGSNSVYYSGESYTLTNASSGTITWSATAPFTIHSSSGNTAKVSKISNTSSGTGTLSAKINGVTVDTKIITAYPIAIDGSSGISGGGNCSYLLPASGATYYWDDGQYITVTSGRTSVVAFYTAPYNVSSHDYVGCTVTYNGVSNYFYKMIQIYP